MAPTRNNEPSTPDATRTGAEADTEETPLLGNNLPPEVAPGAPYQRKVVILSMVLLVVLLFGDAMQTPPAQQILEGVVCRQYHPELALGNSTTDICKEDKRVQGRVASIWGLVNACDTIPPILVSIPYGVIADKYGRRPVLTLSLVGIALRMLWFIFPLRWPDVFPIWTLYVAAGFQFIGGGAGMLSAMIWTILADAIPVEIRTDLYLQITSVTLICDLFLSPMTALLMAYSPWMALLLGLSCFVLGVPVSMLMPETLKLRQEADEQIEHTIHGANGTSNGEGVSAREEGSKRNIFQQMVFSARNDMEHVWKFVVGNPGVMMLLLSYDIEVISKFAKVVLFLQYSHHRYDWTWPQATFVLTIGSITNIVLLTLILPGLGWIIVKKLGKPPLVKDLWLLRAEGVIVIVGTLLIAIAPTRWSVIMGLVVFSLGGGVGSYGRSLMNSVIEPHTIATLNTLLGVVEMVSLLVFAPAIAELLSLGIRLGGAWEGLPFYVAAGCAALGCFITFLYRLPRTAGSVERL